MGRLTKLFNYRKRKRNAIHVIHPYRDLYGWVFDDPETGLCREPFILGASEMIDRVLWKAGINADRTTQCSLAFSARPIPGHHLSARAQMAEGGGMWYTCDDEPRDMAWLCPALFLYFRRAPEHLYVRALNG